MEELKIGVVGYCPPTKFDEAQALRMINEAYDILAQKFPDSQKTVVSGLTNVGIPALAYGLAAKKGWKTIGIACKKARDFECFPVDDVLFIGREWGEESPVFLDSIDVLVRIGGGKQAHAEAEEFKKRGYTVLEYELEAKE